uniref:Uncharacterized protein n=1 Tax=Tanacetum cinerariifolium TaxID=118510 RepID=A0A699GHP8_TANCI|nr:hypothetical protein [Tanacetum cinerariifolium]
MDAYESDPEAPEAAPQSPDQAPLSPAHALEDLEEDPKQEEELSAPADSLPAGLYIDLPFEGMDVSLTSGPLPSSINALVESWVAASTPLLPPPSPILPLSSPLPRIPSPPLLLPPPTRRDIIPEADMPPQKRARFEVNERVTHLATSHRHDSHEFYVRHQDTQSTAAAQDDADMLTRHIQRDGAREDARDLEHHDGPADADNIF